MTDKAWEYFSRSKQINEEKFGSDSPEVAMDLNGLGITIKESKDPNKNLDEAEELHLKALAIFEKAFGYNHEKVALTLNYLAEVYRKQSKYGYDGAEKLYERALKINRNIFGTGDHPEIAENLNGLAQVYKCQQSYRKSEPLFIEAIAMSERTLGEYHPHVINRYKNYADMLERSGRVLEAQKVWEKVEVLKKKGMELK